VRRKGAQGYGSLGLSLGRARFGWRAGTVTGPHRPTQSCLPGRHVTTPKPATAAAGCPRPLPNQERSTGQPHSVARWQGILQAGCGWWQHHCGRSLLAHAEAWRGGAPGRLPECPCASGQRTAWMAHWYLRPLKQDVKTTSSLRLTVPLCCLMVPCCSFSSGLCTSVYVT